MARQQRQQDKFARRLQKKKEQPDPAVPGGPPGEDPDIAGIRPGPQPPIDDLLNDER